MSTHHLAHYRVGAELARYVRSRTGQGGPPVTALQAVVADIAATTPNLAIPLRDLVSRQGFQVLIPLAGSGSGELQRKALVDDIRQLYHPDVVQALVEVLNGFLELRSETATRFEKSVDSSGVITPKEAVETNTGEYSIKDIGSYDPRYMQPDRDRAMEELERNFIGRQQYLEREIERLSNKSDYRGGTANLNPIDVRGKDKRYAPTNYHTVKRASSIVAVCGVIVTTIIVVVSSYYLGYQNVGIFITIAGLLLNILAQHL